MIRSSSSSLATRLTRPLMLAVVGVWLLCTALVAWYVDGQIQHNFDVELIESAHRQLYPALLDSGLAQVAAEPSATPAGASSGASSDASNGAAPDAAAPKVMGQVPGSAFSEPMLLQLRASTGAVLLRTPHAPAAGFAAPLEQGFHDSAEHRIYTLHEPGQGLWLQLADPLAERAQARQHTLSGLLLVLAVMLPLLVWLIHLIARRELRSLHWLQGQINQRSSANLQPLLLGDLPQELRLVGEDVNLLLQRLHHALDVERALAANAAHELRTPLAAVRLRLQTALDQAQAQGSAQLPLAEVQLALTALQTLSHRTERLLQLSRAESDSAMLRFAPVDLLLLCDTLAQEFWQQPRAQKRLDWDRGALAPVWVQGDMDTLAIALRNLVDNALTYGSGQVQLLVQAAPAALLVRNGGARLDGVQLQQLRQRHVRLSSEHMGYGLGLSIVASIAQRHQAQLLLESPIPGRDDGVQAQLLFAPQ